MNYCVNIPDKIRLIIMSVSNDQYDNVQSASNTQFVFSFFTPMWKILIELIRLEGDCLTPAD